jgi:hypothetical protein
MNDPINRRDALKSVGLLSFATALDLTPPQLERALSHMAVLAESREPGAENAQSYAPKFFTTSEWRLVRMLSDYVIPRDARSGSATEAKVPEYMDFLLADREASEASKVAMRGGLAWLNQESRRRFGAGFVAATDARRRQILDDIAFPAKAKPEVSQGVAFFTRFRDLTASGFFSSQMGWNDLRYVGNVALPSWDGCPPAALRKLGVSYDLMKPRDQ